MTAFAMPDLGPGGGPRRGSPVTVGRVIAVGGLALAALVVWNLLSAQLVTKRPNEARTVQVVLPPPPPPPPPEVKPIEKPPEPTDAPPVEAPVDTPPPPDQAQPSSEPSTPGDNALTAREGAGPSNYGLAQGDGGGTRIGGRPGGDNGFAAYAQTALSAIRLAAQSDRELARGRFTAMLLVEVDAEGRITRVRVVDTSGDTRRDERLSRVLSGLLLSRRPPPGLPAMRIQLSSRPGA